MPIPVSFSTKSYYLLTKPGIIMGNLITMTAGFILASKTSFNPWLFLSTLIGLGLIIASACVWNNYIDRHHDKKMERTKNRALASGQITRFKAIAFACVLGIIGTFVMSYFVNALSLFISLFGFIIYVLIYSFSKYLTIHGTLIGSIAGAVPPVVGYTAVSNSLDPGAFIFFTIIALWQMPHFFAISIRRLEDYRAASIPVLPLKRGLKNTKIQMLFYITAFIGACSLLTIYKYTGYIYLSIIMTTGILWLIMGVQGFKAKDETKWARNMFLFSLVTIMVLSITIACNSYI